MIHSYQEAGSQLVKLIAIFSIGREVESKKSLAQSMASMLKKSTQSMDFKTLQDTIESYGASIEFYASSLYITAEMHCLSKYFIPISEILLKIIYEAKFTEFDWNITRTITQENTRQNQFQTDYWSERMLSDSVYGKGHLLGYYSDPENYDNISTEDIQKYYQEYIQPFKPEIFIAGDISSQYINHFDQAISQYSEKSYPIRKMNPFQENAILYQEKKIEEAAQASVRLGNVLSRDHVKDFLALEIWSMLLGGHYMSELMIKLRQDLGLTYGVYTHLVHHQSQSILHISFETEYELVRESQDAILSVFQRLQLESESRYRPALAQYFSQWSKQSEKALQNVAYAVKMWKLGYDLNYYENYIKDYVNQDLEFLNQKRDEILQFRNYHQAIAY